MIFASMQQMVSSIANDPDVIAAAGNNANNPWLQTSFAPYVLAMTRSKGKYGEVFTEKLLSRMGFYVDKSSTNGHDRRVDGVRTEIKFSLASFNRKKGVVIPDRWMLNHVSGSKEWDRLIFVGLNLDLSDSVITFMTKQDFYTALGCLNINNRSKYFSHQQGGYQLKNDDYMSSGKKLQALLADGALKGINLW